MKVGLYSRCSTSKQDLESQRTALIDWANKNGYEYTYFEDMGISGRTNSRNGINSLIESARNKEFEILGIVELSRIGRSIKFICTIVEELAKLGIKIVLVNSNTTIDYNILEGSVLINALAMASDIEWRLINERNQRGRERIKEKGIKVGRKERDISIDAIKLFLEKGYSQLRIADELKVSVATVNRRIKNFKIGHICNVSNSNSKLKENEQNSKENETVFQKEVS